MLKLFKLTIFLLSSICLLGFWNSNKMIDSSVDKNKVQTGEVFTYQITINGDFSAATLFPPEFNDFKIISQEEKKDYSVRGGVQSLSFKLTYHLFAPKSGVFTIEEAVLKDNDQQFKSNPIKIEVRGRSLQEKKKILPYIEKGIDL